MKSTFVSVLFTPLPGERERGSGGKFRENGGHSEGESNLKFGDENHRERSGPESKIFSSVSGKVYL